MPSPLLFLDGTPYPALIVGLMVSWALGFVIARAVLKGRSRPTYLTGLSLLCGLLMSPVILGLLTWAILSIVTSLK